MRQAQKIIIDGYNVIYTDDRLRRIAIRDLEGARERFTEGLKAYIGDKRIQVTVVFDGKAHVVDAESIIPGKLQVVFSGAGQTADDVIVSMLEQSENARQYIVVTSDMAHIGGIAKKLGCHVIGSKRFLERVLQAPDRRANRSRPEGEKPEPSGDDTDFWMEQFGDGDENPGSGSRKKK